eukprot:CAMPEP_0114395164 /NCGR_PEP_ID=MMETSP0102-20121206/12690_1 /TAXON_ID=38822 ORGANISM="Pteridomonas danica, Strain PT" /NCGR_SAMPLE_ID=MMETSP0102 /ASSEMBLY_ACC=CAM_ASM_000212 /LENGTH=83 /DNA_ID=CAMNT_0001555401 /DNA_START=14 /DNA_END=265 /DNA_ORIENTATION=-
MASTKEIKPLGLYDHLVHMRLGDVMAFTGITVGSSAYGWFFGKPLRAQTAATAGVLGSTAGFLYAYQNIHHRILADMERNLKN